MIGRQTAFVRFGGCDYRCDWCDSLFAVLPEQVKEHGTKMDARAIVDRIESRCPAVPWVTLSGGNPVMHDLTFLVKLLHDRGFQVAVETQGSLYRDWVMLCDQITVSPKPPSSRQKTDWESLDLFGALPEDSTCMKVVVFDEEDLLYAEQVALRYPHLPIYLQVGNAVGHDSVPELLRKLDWLIQAVQKRVELSDAIILPQLHVLLWGNQRGV